MDSEENRKKIPERKRIYRQFQKEVQQEIQQAHADSK